jgi:hypothetical protein
MDGEIRVSHGPKRFQDGQGALGITIPRALMLRADNVIQRRVDAHGKSLRYALLEMSI